MEWWMIGLAANVVVAAAYLAIPGTIGRSLIRRGEWRANPLAVATTAIFFSCSLGHGAHAAHLLLPSFGLELREGLAMREAMHHWHGVAFDILTAGVGVYYWTLRSRFPALVRGGAIFEDLRARRMQALVIHDNVVQGLATAKLSLELGETETGMAALEETLEAARRIMSELEGLDEDGSSPVYRRPLVTRTS